MIVRLQFEGIRCFSAPQDAVIRPLTLLVGENSSGKSTFLALCQIASSLSRGFTRKIPFNEPPFLLGAYDQIASYRAGGAKSFSIGVSVGDDPRTGSVRAEFTPKHGQPSLSAWRLAVGDWVLQVVATGEQDAFAIVLESPQGRHEIPHAPSFALFQLVEAASPQDWADSVGLKTPITVSSQSEMSAFGDTLKSIRKAFGRRTYAFAPIRTSPQRTYDPVSAEPQPEGSHVPMLLASLSRSAANAQWAVLKSALTEFGSESGLFEQIEVIQKGKKESDPFQIGVRSGGPAFNLVDVGYGVSQALPILVDILQPSATNEVFLLQQPEVHLHPRAQAELGSFFAREARARGRFVIETHSDYLIDRVRMEVRRRTLRPKDVSLLYFERQKQGAVIHNLELDKDGAIANPPAGYRQFFLNEERALLDV
jgi:hypothetical protein